VSVLGALHGYALIEPVDALYFLFPYLKDVAGVLPVFADSLAPWLPCLYGVGCEQHAELLDELVVGILGADAPVYLGVARLNDAGYLFVCQVRVEYGPDVGRRAVRYPFSPLGNEYAHACILFQYATPHYCTVSRISLCIVSRDRVHHTRSEHDQKYFI